MPRASRPPPTASRHRSKSLWECIGDLFGPECLQLQPFGPADRPMGVDSCRVTIVNRGLMRSLPLAGASALLLSLVTSPAHPQAAPPASRPGATAVAASDT